MSRQFKVARRMNHLKLNEAADKLGVSESTIYRAIKQLKEQEYIRREGSDKKGKWIILKEI